MEVDRTQMRRVLARAVGMSEAEVQRIDWPECYWDPERSWADAGRLLEAMKTRHSSTVPSPNLDTWGRFCQRIIARLPERTGPAILNEHGGLNSYSNFPMPRDVISALATIGPSLIAQAAYEALEAS